MNTLLVIEDDPDVQHLVEAIFSMDSRFSLAGVAKSAEEGLESAGKVGQTIVVLDHGLAGEMTGLEVAAKLKELVAGAKIILFTVHAELQATADADASIDAFLLKTDPMQLLPLAQRLSGLSADAG